MDLHRLDPDAVRSIQRLGERGHDAYLVGGCVRDLLLDRDPKDFDIATDARPQQVKRAFPRNCRIIGRRFKLAHLHFNSNQKILEVATFRSSPAPINPEDDDDSSSEEEEDLLIVRDNEFGTIEEDALRRDFTINALFHDPIRDKIIDYVGGIADVTAHVIRTIGDPETRFREDPIRILRAAKFAGRLRFTLAPETAAAMRAAAPDLTRAAPPRILEEILRLLRGGHAVPSFQILRDVGGLAALLPSVHEYLEAADLDERRIFWRLLDALDNHIHNGAEPSNAVLLGCVFLRPVLRRFAAAASRSPSTVAEEIIGPLAVDLRLPRRDTGALKRICAVHPRFTATGKRRFRLASFLEDPHLLESMELFELSCYATLADFDDLVRWRRLLAEAGVPEVAAAGPARRDDSRGRGDRPSPAAESRQGHDRKREGRGREGRGRPDQRERADNRERSDRERSDRGERGRRGGKPEKRERKARDRADRRDRPDKRDGVAARKDKKPRRSKQDEVLTLEPEAIDVSAFDRELAPREVPRFDTIVDSGGGAKRKRPVKIDEDDSYRPPPPPGGGPPGPDLPPPPGPSSGGDVFGDW